MAELQPKSACPFRQFGQTELAVIGDPRLTDTDKTVYTALKAHRNHRSGTAWPSRTTLARIVGIHPDSVSRSTRRLVELGYLEKQHQGGRGNATLYRFPLAETTAKPHGERVYSDRSVRVNPPTPIQEQTIQNPPQTPPLPDPAPMAACGEFFYEPSAPEVHREPRRENPTPLPTLEFPHALAAAIGVHMARMLAGLPPSEAQMLVDEFAGNAQRHEIRNPLGYLRRLIELHRTGRFVPELAELVRIERERKREAEVRYAAALRIDPLDRYRKPEPASEPKPKRDISGHIAAMRTALRN